MTLNTVAFASLLFLGGWTAQAKTFQNSYIRFEIPDNWNCAQEGIAWVCAPASSLDAREALIVVTAKVAGPEDNLAAYEKYLRKPKSLSTRSKTASFSRLLSVDHKIISGQEWVEAVHFGGADRPRADDGSWQLCRATRGASGPKTSRGDRAGNHGPRKKQETSFHFYRFRSPARYWSSGP